MQDKIKFRPTTRSMVFTGLFAAILCVISPLSIPIGAVPITLSVFAVLLTGALLPPAQAACATLVYILLGSAGLPVFSNMHGGAGVLFGATGGFIMAYPLMALTVSLAVRFLGGRKLLPLAAGMIPAVALCYLLGTLWFSHIAGGTLCVLPFIPFDLIKIVAAVTVALAVNKTKIL
ncbi:MAG: biotin transporter BioY [Oscillospiraceae bacterium]